MRILVLFLILSVVSPVIAKPRDWKPAIVATIDSKTNDRGAAIIPIGGGLYGARILITTIWYRVETSDTIYILVWHNKQHPLNVTLHGPTKISVDGQTAHILDDAGKDVKVPIGEKIAKP